MNNFGRVFRAFPAIGRPPTVEKGAVSVERNLVVDFVWGDFRIGNLGGHCGIRGREAEKGVPSHDIPGEVFSNLDPKSFQTCYIVWTASVQEASREIVAIDG